MRLLLITPDYPPATGGIQLLCARLAAHSRHCCEVVCIGAPAPLGVFLGGRARRAERAGVMATPRLRSQLASVAMLNATALARALALRPDAIVSGHIVASPAAVAAQRITGAPVIQMLHAEELGRRPALTRFATARAAASIAVSSHTRDLAISLGAPAQRLHVIHPGVDLPAAGAPPARQGLRPPTIITVARLTDRYKGFDVMLKAMPLIRARVRDARWLLVGEGPLRAELSQGAAALGIADALTFAGAVDDATRDRLLDEADVFAMPSRLLPGGEGGEGFGIVYLEAGAHRLPCVAGNVGGALDAVIDGRTGLLVDPTDHAAIAEAIVTLLTDRELARRLGEAGWRHAQSHSWQRMAGQIDDLIERLPAGRPHPR